VPKPIDAESDRQVRLAQNSLGKLPKPLQTLLEALTELKLDITRERLRQEANNESIVKAALGSSVKYTLKALETCAQTCTEAIDSGIGNYSDTQMQERIEAVLLRASEYIDTRTPETTSAWLSGLKEARRALEAKLSQVLSETTRIATSVRPASAANIDAVSSAVEASKKLRTRLQVLAEGPLKSLFESEDQETPERKPEDTMAKPFNELIEASKYNEIAEVLRDVRSLTRSIEGIFDRIARSQSVVIDDAVSAAALGIEGSARTLNLSQEKYVPNADMTVADDAIQTEIRLLLNTLTVDRGALDSVLRSIRFQCDALVFAANSESASAWNIDLMRWRFQISEAWTKWKAV